MPSPNTHSSGRLKRWLSTVAVVGVVIAAGSYAGSQYVHFSPVPQAARAAAPEQAVAVTVAVVEPRKASLWDEFSGRLEAVERVEVRPRVAGAILATNFTEGSLVKAGDVLFKIDPAPYAAEVDRAQAQLEAARARASFAANELERGAQLVGNSIVTKRDYDQRDNGNREAIANVKAAEAALQAAKLNLDYTQVRAPVDGRVGRIEVTVGNLVAAGSASPVLTNLVSVNPIYASFDATEDVVLRALAAVADGSGKRGNLDRIPVEMTTSGGTTASGHIQLIDNQVQGQTGTIRVRAVFKNETGTLIPGQFARVRMGQPQQQSLVLLDERAIGTDQDKKFVMVVGDDERAVYRPVTLGGSVEGLRIISAGLKPGERVVVNGLQRVRPGALLKTQVAEMGARDGTDTKQLAQR
ncbi:putative component of multidrug efflux pump, acrB/acrD/acrF family [Bradyrhizobium sp. ORS 375]|uniref:efflux RND transporter periplasmic adaptor subunit n=1 Tax=Bradyrhizobium sp. (strain ORS 375) TaxID=566679 RepID=UPI0002405E57|nr:efflux RND transporter periplasmic adaptor subunit [Bradyrhizobium sp. ORS 375]CCD94446.1 putative component of multidrug efflux pump, acrB/acrD/acrF family [Bradyrhizobium sp. ORS 375]